MIGEASGLAAGARRLVCLCLWATLSMSAMAEQVAQGDWIEAADAVHLAAASPDGVPGSFGMVVAAQGTDRGVLYLNSELDYRDQRNLSIAIPRKVAKEIKQRTGVAAANLFGGRRIVVDGKAERVKIWFAVNGQRTNKYYYQTHVRLTSADQIRILVNTEP